MVADQTGERDTEANEDLVPAEPISSHDKSNDQLTTRIFSIGDISLRKFLPSEPIPTRNSNNNLR
jgi:hypothetical protein